MLQAMRRDVDAVEAGQPPNELDGWSPDDVNDMLTAWAFLGEYIPGPARLRWHSVHPDLDIVVPWQDPVQYYGVLKVAVELVETLKSREEVPRVDPKTEGQL